MREDETAATEGAFDVNGCSYTRINTKWTREGRLLTWDTEIVKCHPREARERGAPFHPPCENILGLFWIGSKIAVKFVRKLRSPWCRQGGQIIKDVGRNL
jgi:hypothetical protein